MKLPQLSLRDLFWLVLVCALAVGWGVDHVRLAPDFERHMREYANLSDFYLQRIRQLEEQLKEAGELPAAWEP